MLSNFYNFFPPRVNFLTNRGVLLESFPESFFQWFWIQFLVHSDSWILCFFTKPTTLFFSFCHRTRRYWICIRIPDLHPRILNLNQDSARIHIRIHQYFRMISSLSIFLRILWIFLGFKNPISEFHDKNSDPRIPVLESTFKTKLESTDSDSSVGF